MSSTPQIIRMLPRDVFTQFRADQSRITPLITPTVVALATTPFKENFSASPGSCLEM